MKRKIKNVIYLVIAISIFGLASGVTGVAYAITNGQFDGDEAYPYVGAANNGVVFCSGVAISPYIFVTAAHCFFYPGETVWVTFDPAPFAPGSPPPVYHEGIWYPHPDFCLGCGPGTPGFDTHDIAVVVFDEDQKVILDEYAELPTEGLVDTLPMRTELTLVGYGAQDFIRGGGPPEPLFLLARYSALSELIASHHKHSGEYMKVTANPAQGKGGFCLGDSGGPNLLGGTRIILGITCYGSNPLCEGVGYSNRLDLPYALEFIESFME